MRVKQVTKKIYKMEMFSRNNEAPKFCQKNFKLINTFLKYDSNYNSVEDFEGLEFNETYGGILTKEKDSFFNFKTIEDYGSEEEYIKNDSLYKVIASIDKLNSTHLASEGQKGGNRGRIRTAEGVYKISNFKERLYNRDPKLVDEIANLGGKNNFSFASKFCTYLCRYLFNGSKQENNYCIYDEVVQSILPYYIYAYKAECGSYYRTDTNGNNISIVNKVKIKGGYTDYINIIDSILLKVKKVSKIDVTYEAFDHLLWYYFKGQPNKVQSLMNTLPKLK